MHNDTLFESLLVEIIKSVILSCSPCPSIVFHDVKGSLEAYGNIVVTNTLRLVSFLSPEPCRCLVGLSKSSMR